MFTLIPLGTNGYMPTWNRHTMSFLLIDEYDDIILIDAGTGVSRFFEHQHVLRGPFANPHAIATGGFCQKATADFASVTAQPLLPQNQ